MDDNHVEIVKAGLLKTIAKFCNGGPTKLLVGKNSELLDPIYKDFLAENKIKISIYEGDKS